MKNIIGEQPQAEKQIIREGIRAEVFISFIRLLCFVALCGLAAWQIIAEQQPLTLKLVTVDVMFRLGGLFVSFFLLVYSFVLSRGMFKKLYRFFSSSLKYFAITLDVVCISYVIYTAMRSLPFNNEFVPAFILYFCLFGVLYIFLNTARGSLYAGIYTVLFFLGMFAGLTLLVPGLMWSYYSLTSFTDFRIYLPAGLFVACIVFSFYLIFRSHKNIFRTVIVDRLGRIAGDIGTGRILQNKEKLPIEGTRTKATVVTAVITNYGRLAQELSAAVLAQLLEGVYREIRRAVFLGNGIIASQQAGKVVAVFGESFNTGGDATGAVNAALAIAQYCDGFNLNRVRSREPKAEVGIGIHTGWVIFHPIGTDESIDCAVFGKTVDTSGAILKITKIVRAPVIVSDVSYREQESNLEFRRLGRARIKDRPETVGVYALYPDSPQNKREKRNFEKIAARKELVV
ncbi:MAG: adenylate/guanylate cyclase domain-containing protein [Spirochaetales bacterium]|nr:adenylate/guanylate cyclase domain-containing protein [Spirochaetales bacterium]